MNARNVLRLSLLAGEIMLSNGAETYRVEDTMKRILVAFDCKDAEAFVTTTGIFASVSGEAPGPVSMIKRVKTRTYHMEKLARVNALSRRIADGRIGCEDAEAVLLQIQNLPPYPLLLRILFSGVSCFSFCYMFGGQWRDCFCALLIGFLVYYVFDALSRRGTSVFLVNIICGAAISLVTVLFLTWGVGVRMDKIIIGSIMPLVPGVAITNAVRDILEGDYLSGTSRTVDAIFVAVAIATGVGTVLRIWLALWGGLPI